LHNSDYLGDALFAMGRLVHTLPRAWLPIRKGMYGTGHFNVKIVVDEWCGTQAGHQKI